MAYIAVISMAACASAFSTTRSVTTMTLTEAQVAARKTSLEFTPTKYFFGRVDVFLGEQFKPLSETIEPTFGDDGAVSSVVVEPPFGMIIEESANFPGKIEVIEIVPESNAEKVGIMVGDILRGTTAMALNIAKASEEDAAFSVGFSEGKRQVAFLNTDRKPFETVMAALKSNAVSNGGPGEACLILERRVKTPSEEEEEVQEE